MAPRAIELVSAETQIGELRAVVRRPFFQARLKASEIGRMVNDIRRLAVMYDSLPVVSRSPDPSDDYLLALCEVANADYLVSGDKSHLLALGNHKCTRILTARELADLFA